MKIRYILLLCSLFFSIESQAKNYIPLNQQVMYSYWSEEKTPEQKSADQEFIDKVILSGITRRDGAEYFLERSKEAFEAKEYDYAIKRANQAWLLDNRFLDIYLQYIEIMEAKGDNKRNINRVVGIAEQIFPNNPEISHYRR